MGRFQKRLPKWVLGIREAVGRQGLAVTNTVAGPLAAELRGWGRVNCRPESWWWATPPASHACARCCCSSWRLTPLAHVATLHSHSGPRADGAPAPFVAVEIA